MPADVCALGCICAHACSALTLDMLTPCSNRCVCVCMCVCMCVHVCVCMCVHVCACVCVCVTQMSSDELKDTLRARYAADVDPPLSATGDYISNTMGVEGYRYV